MRVRSYIYDSDTAAPHVESVLEHLDARDEDVDRLDVGTASDPGNARREAMLTVKGAVRIGSVPSELFDESGSPDFSAGALVTESPTGRRTLHVGSDALDVLRGPD